jgi:hypothetical protein
VCVVHLRVGLLERQKQQELQELAPPYRGMIAMMQCYVSDSYSGQMTRSIEAELDVVILSIAAEETLG